MTAARGAVGVAAGPPAGVETVGLIRLDHIACGPAKLNAVGGEEVG